MKKRRVRKPHRIKRKKQLFKISFFWLGFLIFIAAIFYFLFFSSFFQVEKVIVSGNKKVSTEDVKDIVQRNLERRILFFKSKSIFLVNLKEIRGDILNNFLHIAEVEISRQFPNVLDVIVVERLALAIWCQNERCFSLDKEGIIFEETQPKDVLAKIKDPQDIGLFILGKRVIEKEYLEKILQIQRKLLRELKIGTEEFIVFSEERLNTKTLEGWEIYFNPTEDIEWQLTKLEAVLKEEIPVESRENLEYIELRFGNFAPYKYRDVVEAVD